MFIISSCLCPIHRSQVLSPEWRCSWSSADRRYSNYIWVINNCTAYRGATYIRGLTIYYKTHKGTTAKASILLMIIQLNYKFDEYWLIDVAVIDLVHKSHNTPVLYPTMHNSEQKCAHLLWNRWIVWFVRLVYYNGVIFKLILWINILSTYHVKLLSGECR